MSVVEVQQLTKAFSVPATRRHTVREHVLGLFRPTREDRLKVLDEVTFSVPRGQAIGIMGRNGCGKSTLLKILAGVYEPDGGKVAIHADVTPILELGVGGSPDLTAVDNIYLMGTVLGLTIREIRASIDEILAFAELERFAYQHLKFFSSGMQSRLAFAVAFQAAREVLILDEIYAVGDAGFQDHCRDRVQALKQRGHTILLVSHGAANVTSFCDRAILLEEGKITRDGPADDVAKAYGELVRRHNDFPAQPGPIANTGST
jgi:ABC-2 type transport system ATP-binding protein